MFIKAEPALHISRHAIKYALAGPKQGARLTINHSAGRELGYGYARASSQRMTMHAVRIVIDIQEYNGKPCYILTAFPTP